MPYLTPDLRIAGGELLLNLDGERWNNGERSGLIFLSLFFFSGGTPGGGAVSAHPPRCHMTRKVWDPSTTALTGVEEVEARLEKGRNAAGKTLLFTNWTGSRGNGVTSSLTGALLVGKF